MSDPHNYRNEPVFIYFAPPPPEDNREVGWWWRIGNYDPEGPFDSQTEAIQSLAKSMEGQGL